MGSSLLSVSENCFPVTEADSRAAWKGSTTHRQPSLLEEQTVSVKSISSRKFNRFLPAHNHLGTAIGEEVEWFADDRENSIGTIAFSTEERGWNYAILQRDWMGDFQVGELKANFRNVQAARINFLRAMAATEGGGQAILLKD